MSTDQLDPVERYFLLLLYAPDSTDKFARPIHGKTWLQKEMFLISKLRTELGKRTEFDPHHLGAYSTIVYEIEDQFYISEYVERVGTTIKLSLEGRKIAEDVWQRASDEDKRVVAGVKTLLNDLPELELLGFIYSEYPDTAVNSEKRNEVEIRRVEIAISLLLKGKVALEKAAEIARQSVESFIRTLKERGFDLSDIETKSVLLDRQLLQELEQSKKESERRELVSWEAIRNNP